MPRKKRQGKLIVIDGTDGSGKATQTALLLKRLRKEGYRAAQLDFPRYESNFFGKFIGECLAGKHGDFAGLDPRIASVLYAADRFESKPLLTKWLAEGRIVILDRYVSSNQIHQGGKVADAAGRREFLGWLDRLEFDVFGLPRPDAILYLDVPLAVTQKLLRTKGQQEKKTYLEGRGKDTVEQNSKYLADSQESARRLVRRQNNWIRIDCFERGALLPRETVAERVWQHLEHFL